MNKINSMVYNLCKDDGIKLEAQAHESLVIVDHLLDLLMHPVFIGLLASVILQELVHLVEKLRAK